MKNKVEHRCRILEMVDRNHITLKEAASLVSLSYRHLRRLYKRYKDNGESGFVHGLQGKKSNRKIKKNLRKKILSRYKKDYQHYGPTFTAQKLSHLGYAISRETLRRWLIDEGLWRQNEKHIYQRCNKKVQKNFGERIWLFVHEHTWLGKTYNNLYLFCLMDEATGVTLSYISEKNTTRAAMKILWM
jgi:transposase